jgi:DNA-binding beta-propeller fold protein YncE
LKSRIHTFFIFLLLWVPAAILAQGVKFVKTIDFKENAGKKSISSFLFGRKEQKMVKPGSICWLRNNYLGVTDAVNGAVIILEKNGKIRKRITGFKGGRLISPVSCCTDETGNLYISDSARQVVLQFDQKFKFKKVFISYPQSRITGILFSKGMFYCVDTRNHRILCFNRAGDLAFSFGKRGGAEGEFNFPTHITADNDYIYITDAMNFRVQVFDRSGKFIRGFGGMGRGGGNFSKPKGIAVDPEQRIFIADAMFDNVQIFNMKGEFLYYFGSPGHRGGEFWMPSDVLVESVNSDNFIWVADTYNSRIQVFKLIKEAQ